MHFQEQCYLSWFSKFSFAIFFKLLTLFLCFLYLQISEFLWFFNITLRSLSLIHISFRISLVNHGLSFYLTVIALVGIHSLANSRNVLVNWLHMSSTSSNWQRRVIQSTISSFSINFCLSTLSYRKSSCRPCWGLKICLRKILSCTCDLKPL